MKKLTLLLAMFSMLTFAACNGDGDKEENAEDTTSMEQQEITEQEMAPPQEPYELVPDTSTTPHDYCIYQIDQQVRLGAGQTAYEHKVGDKICIRCDDKLDANKCDKISRTAVSRLLFEVDATDNQYKLDVTTDLFCISCPPGLSRYMYK